MAEETEVAPGVEALHEAGEDKAVAVAGVEDDLTCASDASSLDI